MPLPGYQWVNNSKNGGGDYVSGYPASILLHMTVSMGISASYISGHAYPPHCWANPYNGDKFQTVELGRSGYALYQPSYTNSYTNRKWHCIQTELVGVPEVSIATYTKAQCDWIAANVVVPQVQWLRQHGMDVNLNNVRYHTNTSGSASEYWHGRLSDGEWAAFDGLCAHIDAVGNDHWDCSAERTDWIAQESQRILGGGLGPTPITDLFTEDENEMMRIVEQVGGGGRHGNGTIWAISPSEPKAWPISNQYTVNVMQAHGILMTWQQMKDKGLTWQTDGGSITSTYEVMPILETIPDK